jgi:hypothetical protein
MTIISSTSVKPASCFLILATDSLTADAREV